MLTGYHCHEQVNVTAGMLKQAITTLKKFYFVGVTDRFREAVEVFHKLVNTGSKPSSIELAVYRGGAYSPEDRAACEQWMAANKYEDPYDAAIYKLATELFNQTFKRVGSLGKRSNVVQKGKIAPRKKNGVLKRHITSN